MILTVQRYLELTGDLDNAPDAIERALVDAQAKIEKKLRRELESDERTETLYVKTNGRVYPSVTPVTDAGDYEIIDGGVVVGDFFQAPINFISGQPSSIELTYTGGYEADTLPIDLEEAIADTAYDLLHASSSEYPAGATSIRLGDAAITFAKPVGTLRASVTDTIVRYQRRRV